MKKWVVTIYITATLVALAQILNLILRFLGVITHLLFSKIEVVLIILALALWLFGFITIIMMNDQYPKKSGK